MSIRCRGSSQNNKSRLHLQRGLSCAIEFPDPIEIHLLYVKWLRTRPVPSHVRVVICLTSIEWEAHKEGLNIPYPSFRRSAPSKERPKLRVKVWSDVAAAAT